MERFERLDSVLDHIWEKLERAAGRPEHPWGTLSFGTLEGAAPHVRTVALRRVESETRHLAFHSDRRAQKVADIRASEQIAWLGWDSEGREQVCLRGRATVHVDDVVADQMWNAEDPASLGHYLRPQAPGAPVDHPTDGRPSSPSSERATRADVAEGRQHFAAIRTVVDEIDWVHLHPEGHYRAQFHFEPSTRSFDKTWVIP